MLPQTLRRGFWASGLPVDILTVANTYRSVGLYKNTQADLLFVFLPFGESVPLP